MKDPYYGFHGEALESFISLKDSSKKTTLESVWLEKNELSISLNNSEFTICIEDLSYREEVIEFSFAEENLPGKNLLQRPVRAHISHYHDGSGRDIDVGFFASSRFVIWAKGIKVVIEITESVEDEGETYETYNRDASIEVTLKSRY